MFACASLFLCVPLCARACARVCLFVCARACVCASPLPWEDEGGDDTDLLEIISIWERGEGEREREGCLVYILVLRTISMDSSRLSDMFAHGARGHLSCQMHGTRERERGGETIETEAGETYNLVI